MRSEYTLAKHITEHGNCFRECQHPRIQHKQPCMFFINYRCIIVSDYLNRRKIEPNAFEVGYRNRNSYAKESLKEWALEKMEEIKKIKYVESLE